MEYRILSQKKKLVESRINPIIKGIVMITIITMSLFHIFLNDKSDAMISHKKNYTPIIQKRNSSFDAILQQLKNDEISKDEYIATFEEIKTSSKKELKVYTATKKQLAIEHSFNGRSSFRFWIFVFGLSFSFFVLAIRYVYFNIKNNKSILLKKSFILEASAWLTVSFFWVLHAVVARNSDFDTKAYLLTGVFISVLMAVSILLFIKYLAARKIKEFKVIADLISLVSDLKVNHYFKMASLALSKSNKETIEADTKQVNTKINKTLTGVNEL